MPAAIASLLALSGCGGGNHARNAEPTTTLITTDTWVPPPVSGPPSITNFCALVTSVYRHEAQVPETANLTVRKKFVQDYVTLEPEVVVESPPDIAVPARLYLGSVAQILAALEHADLDYKKIHSETVGALLLDPAVKSAGDQVIAYTQQHCNYTIGGA